MKDKNLPDDIKAKSLDELREILNSLLTKIETSPNLENSADDYQKLIKVDLNIISGSLMSHSFVGIHTILNGSFISIAFDSSPLEAPMPHSQILCRFCFKSVKLSQEF